MSLTCTSAIVLSSKGGAVTEWLIVTFFLQDFEKAVDRVIGGLERATSLVSEDEKRTVVRRGCEVMCHILLTCS